MFDLYRRAILAIYPYSDWITAWATVLTALATGGLIYVAWTQLRAIQATSSSDFAHRLSDDLSTVRSRAIRQRIRQGGIRFDKSGGAPSFFLADRKLFSAFELDENLLAPLEAIGIYVERHAIDMEIAYEMFGSQVIEVWPDPEVQKYVASLRERPNGWDLYDKLEIFYAECISFQEEKKKKTSKKKA